MPKYNIGDTVWQIKDNKCVSFKVSGVQRGTYSYIYKYSVSEWYLSQLGNRHIEHNYEPETNFFPSKEALLQHLSEE